MRPCGPCRCTLRKTACKAGFLPPADLAASAASWLCYTGASRPEGPRTALARPASLDTEAKTRPVVGHCSTEEPATERSGTAQTGAMMIGHRRCRCGTADEDADAHTGKKPSRAENTLSIMSEARSGQRAIDGAPRALCCRMQRQRHMLCALAHVSARNTGCATESACTARTCAHAAQHKPRCERRALHCAGVPAAARTPHVPRRNGLILHAYLRLRQKHDEWFKSQG